MSKPGPQPPAPRRPGRRRTASFRGVGALFDPDLERVALERMLLACAVHPTGPGFRRAHLLLWNPNRECLDGRLSWAERVSRPLGEALTSARQQASEGTDADSTSRLRSLRLSPGELDGAMAAAWATRHVAVGGALVFHPCSEARTLGVVPLTWDHGPFGLVVGEWSATGPIAGRVALLEDWRAFANAALAVHARASEARRRSDRAAALAAFAEAAASPANVAELGQALVRLVAQAIGARGVVLWRGQGADRLGLVSSFGPAGVRDRLGRGLTPLAAHSLALGRAIVHDQVAEAYDLSPEVAVELSSVVAVPIVAYGRALGALAAYDRLATHPSDRMAFDAEDVECLEALADLCAVALAQAHGDEVRHQMERARRDLLHQLGRSERQATLGETAARAIHEARNPLATIGAFARRVHRGLPEHDLNREYLEVVIREAERLEALLARSQGPPAEPPSFRMESLNGLVQASLQEAGERLVRRRVRLLKKLSPDVPPLLLDAERLGRVIRNVIGHALERVGPGGRVRVESRRLQQFAVVEIADDGPARPGEAISELFVPFALGGTESSDLALSMARQVVWQHGGEVRVRSEGEWSTIFSLTVPIRGNEDRRKPASDRRVTRRDRRARAPVPSA